MIDIYGDRGRDVFDSIEQYMRERPDTNWFPFVSSLMPMRVFRDVLNSTYEELSDSRLDLTDENSTVVQRHLEWFGKENLKSWVDAKREGQIHHLIGQTADQLRMGMSAREVNERMDARARAEEEMEAQRERIDVRLAATALGRKKVIEWQPLYEILYSAVDPYMRPRFNKFLGVELT